MTRPFLFLDNLLQNKAPDDSPCDGVIAKLTLTQASVPQPRLRQVAKSWSLNSLSLITSVAVIRRIGRETAGAGRAPTRRARVLVTTTISTCASRHLDAAVPLGWHARSTKAILRIAPTTATGAWSKGGLMICRIAWHRRCRRMRTTLRCHWPGTTVLRKAIAGS